MSSIFRNYQVCRESSSVPPTLHADQAKRLNRKGRHDDFLVVNGEMSLTDYHKESQLAQPKDQEIVERQDTTMKEVSNSLGHLNIDYRG